MALTGPQKAALVILYLGEEVANSIFAGMDDAEILSIAEALKGLTRVPTGELTTVIDEFGNMMRNPKDVIVGGDAYVRSMLGKALPTSRANEILSKVGGDPNGPPGFHDLPPREIYRIVRSEHPQTQAAMITLLDPGKVGGVLAEFPREERTEILVRLAKMKTIPRRRLKELEETLAERAQRLNIEAGVELGGERAVAILLNRFTLEDADRSLALLEARDMELADRIRKRMFVFEDLAKVDDRGIQALLKEIPRDTLMMALSVATEEMREKFFKNMSTGAATAMREDIDAAGPVRVADVEAAHDSIIEIARNLEKEGKLIRKTEQMRPGAAA